MPNLEPATLELRLSRRSANRYRIELVFSRPGDLADTYPLGQKVVLLSFPEKHLLEVEHDPVAYGQALGQLSLGNPLVSAEVDTAIAIAEQEALPLQIRLVIGADAPELHALRWETIRHPISDRPLALSEKVLFSRAIGSASWTRVHLRAEGALRALVVVAAPPGLETYNLEPIKREEELARALDCLAPIPTQHLSEPGDVTVTTISGSLRDGCDICYLIAHGVIPDDEEPRLYLDDGTGQVQVVSGMELVRQITDLPSRPSLIVLASCESAGNGTIKALTAIGPQFVLAGVPAVIAMQGLLSFATHARMMPIFFRELQRDGAIDRALAVARKTVSDAEDWWVPVLFTRLRSGKIWYHPGLDENDFSRWPALLNNIKQGNCVPILGPGLLDRLLGTTRDLARALAEKYQFPLAPYARDDLPQVAQYLAVTQDESLMRQEVADRLYTNLCERANLHPTPAVEVRELLSTIGARQRKDDPLNPYTILASFPCKVYLSANHDDLLADALRERERKPTELIKPWNKDLPPLPPDPEQPTVEQPLIYYLFGRLENRDSVVLTEDDYFRYLQHDSSADDNQPAIVTSVLANSALLFLGFRLEDWNFRVLFQSVMSIEGGRRRNRYAHVAVQVDPQDGSLLDPKAARRFLREFFARSAADRSLGTISIYWGSAEDFLREVARHLT